MREEALRRSCETMTVFCAGIGGRIPYVQTRWTGDALRSGTRRQSAAATVLVMLAVGPVVAAFRALRRIQLRGREIEPGSGDPFLGVVQTREGSDATIGLTSAMD